MSDQRTTARDRMVLSAAVLFRERGVDATSLADVIEHANAPRGSIYHHFPGGKTQLVEEATRRAGGLIGSLISASAGDREPTEILESIVDLFRQQMLDSDFTAGCPVAAAALEGGEFPGAKAVAGEAFTSWEATIAAALWQRGVHSPRAQSIATTAIAAIEGALLLARAQRSTQPLDRVGAELATVLGFALEGAAIHPRSARG